MTPNDCHNILFNAHGNIIRTIKKNYIQNGEK